MKDILLHKKWVGAIALVISALVFATCIMKRGEDLVQRIMPVVETQAAQFLPVRIAGGKIVEPRDAYIKRVFYEEAGGLNVVLDTRSDELQSSELKDSGVYFSRKFMYAVTPRKTEIRSLADLPDVKIDEQSLHEVSELIQEKSGSWIFNAALVYILCAAVFCIGLFSLLMNWLLEMMFHNTMRQTIRINTWVYIVQFAVVLFGGIFIGFWSLLLIMFAVNCAVNYLLKQQAAQA